MKIISEKCYASEGLSCVLTTSPQENVCSRDVEINAELPGPCCHGVWCCRSGDARTEACYPQWRMVRVRVVSALPVWDGDLCGSLPAGGGHGARDSVERDRLCGVQSVGGCPCDPPMVPGRVQGHLPQAAHRCHTQAVLRLSRRCWSRGSGGWGRRQSPAPSSMYQRQGDRLEVVPSAEATISKGRTTKFWFVLQTTWYFLLLEFFCEAGLQCNLKIVLRATMKLQLSFIPEQSFQIGGSEPTRTSTPCVMRSQKHKQFKVAAIEIHV